MPEKLAEQAPVLPNQVPGEVVPAEAMYVPEYTEQPKPRHLGREDAIFIVGSELAAYEAAIGTREAESGKTDEEARLVLECARDILGNAPYHKEGLSLSDSVKQQAEDMERDGRLTGDGKYVEPYRQALSWVGNNSTHVEERFTGLFDREHGAHQARGRSGTAKVIRDIMIGEAVTEYQTAQIAPVLPQGPAYRPPTVEEPVSRRPRVSTEPDVPIVRKLEVIDVTDEDGAVPVHSEHEIAETADPQAEAIRLKAAEIKDRAQPKDRHDKIAARLADLRNEAGKKRYDGSGDRSLKSLGEMEDKYTFETANPDELASLLEATGVSGPEAMETALSAHMLRDEDPDASVRVSFWRNDKTGELEYGPHSFEPVKRKRR